MKALMIVALFMLAGCSNKPTTGPDWCMDECGKQGREMHSWDGWTRTCECGDRIKKECK